MENLKPKMAVLLVAAWCAAVAGQPVECQDDWHCNSGVGYYCDQVNNVGKCRKCLSCEELKRSPSQLHKACITSVADCGGCTEGLVEDLAGLQCVPPPAALPGYVWGIVTLVAILIGLAFVAIVVYVLRNRYYHQSTSATVQQGCGSGPTASAPELPPPYTSLYSPVRPDSPPAPLPPHFTDEEASSPFIKCTPPAAPVRESAGHQAANIFNNPNYVRGPHLPTSQLPESEEVPEFLHDETTAESPWRPHEDPAPDNSESSGSSSGSSSGGGGGGAGAASLAGALAAERGTVLVRPPCQDPTPSKVPRLRQDSNNNRNNRERVDEEGLPRGAGAGAGAGAGGTTFNICVNVQQLSDVKL